MLAGTIILALSTLVSSAFAQNATTTIVTRVPVSTVSTTLTRTSTTLLTASTLFSTKTLVSAYPTATPSATAVVPGLLLDTRIDPAFGVLGALLILTGLPSAFWGHKNRWSSFFIIGFYTLAVVCLALILRFGVLQAINPPSETLRGLFVLSCAVAGFVGGGVAIFFWQGTKYFIGGWGGFAFALFIQALHNGGMIKPLGFRYLFYIGCAVIGFVVCTIPKIHYQVLLASTAIVGGSAFMLGVDCYTTAGLKEFYVYNLGFRSLFPKYSEKDFPVTQTMQIELGMMGAVAIMGMAVQARVLIELSARLREINAEQNRRNAEIEAKAAARFREVDQERDEWEMSHGKPGRPRPDDIEASRTLTPDSNRPSSQLSLFKNNGTGKGRSSLTMAEIANQSTPKEERAASPHIDLDLGKSVTQAIPNDLMTENLETRLSAEEKRDPDIKANLELLSELEGIKKTIDAIKTGSDRPSSFAIGARPRLASTGIPLSAQNTVGTGPRPRLSSSTSRPLSTPALNEWDDYVNNRSLFQPPAGISQPVAPIGAPVRPHSITMSPAVQAAIESRQRQEQAYETGGPGAYLEAQNSNRNSAFFEAQSPNRNSAFLGAQAGTSGANVSEDDLPLSHRRRNSSGANSLLQGSRNRPTSQVLVLPPKKPSPTQSPNQPATMTFEELEARHRDKIRALQEPLTKKEAKDAEIAAAKQRWEKSVAVERGVMNKKEQEKRPTSRSFGTLTAERPQRPLSSANKVQEWQRYQDATQRSRNSQTSVAPADNTGTTRSRSKSPIPFPQQGRPHSRSLSGNNL